MLNSEKSQINKIDGKIPEDKYYLILDLIDGIFFLDFANDGQAIRIYSSDSFQSSSSGIFL